MAESELTGVWVAMPTPWTPSGQVDEGIVTELVGRYKDAELHGAYTTGTDGEMHVLELPQFESLVRSFAQSASDVDLPVQVGCFWYHTEGVLDRINIAKEHGIRKIQLATPPWIPLDDVELLRLFEAVYKAAPEIEIIHYNIAKSGRFLTGADYQAILDVAPTLAGSKHTGGDVGSLIDIVQATPELAHFVVDRQIVPGALFGARGFYSFVANLSPDFALALWQLSDEGRWEDAARLAVVSDRFFREWLASTSEINGSPALAKIATAAGVYPEMPLDVRHPYTFGEQHHVDELRKLVDARFPELTASLEILKESTST